MPLPKIGVSCWTIDVVPTPPCTCKQAAVAAVARRATPKVSFGRAEAARREFLYMKLYMDGYNIDVQSCREKITLF